MTPLVLEGHGVRLEPLAAEHREGLLRAGQSADVWAFSPEGVGLTPSQHFERWFARSLPLVGSDAVLPFAVRRLADGALVGSTRYLNYEPAHRRVEVGNTWYSPPARGGLVNPACKLLLMTHAFVALKVQRFELKCDLRNVASQAAISKLGASREGVLRRHLVLGDGYTRDTVYFSVLDREWPQVEAGLLARLVALG